MLTYAVMTPAQVAGKFYQEGDTVDLEAGDAAPYIEGGVLGGLADAASATPAVKVNAPKTGAAAKKK